MQVTWVLLDVVMEGHKHSPFGPARYALQAAMRGPSRLAAEICGGVVRGVHQVQCNIYTLILYGILQRVLSGGIVNTRAIREAATKLISW